MQSELRRPAAATGSAAPPRRLQTQLRRELMLLSAVWLLAATAAFLSLWHETDEVLDSALTEIAQRLLLLPDAALDVPDTADDLATIGLHREFVVYQVFDQQKSLQLRSHDAPATPLDAGAPDGLRRAGDWWVLALTAANGSRRAQVAEALAHRHEVLWDRLVWLLGVLLAMLPLAALGAGWVLRRGFFGAGAGPAGIGPPYPA